MSLKKALVVIIFSGILVLLSIFSQPLQHAICYNDTSVTHSGYTIFSNISEIRHCITGDVIGIRPNVPLLSFNKLDNQYMSEKNEERKASFQKIFNRRLWSTNKRVTFSASGNYHTLSVIK